LVELPLARKKRLEREYHLNSTASDVLASNPLLGIEFEKDLKGAPEQKNYQAVANWYVNELPAFASKAGQSLTQIFVPLSGVSHLVTQIDKGMISVSQAKEVFAEMLISGVQPNQIIQNRGLAQVSDIGAIEKYCDEAIAANPGPAADFKAGKMAALNRIKGHVMKLSQGKANPALVGEILERKLKM
jgi:aspartyl-tRNA(Asn)/glutamyl-tRNA(Gln) amidotransferase subunit B